MAISTGPLRPALLFLCAALLTVQPALPQGIIEGAPQLLEVAPASGLRGGDVEVTLTGQKLDGTRQLLCLYSTDPRLIAPVERGLKGEVVSASENQVRARLHLAADAPPGLHQIRAITAHGLTPPQYFYVSQYPEVAEREPNNDPAQANQIPLPATVVGAIGAPEDRDVFSFSAKAGQTLVFDVDSFKRFSPPQNPGEGIQYLDSFLVLQDAAGRELAYDDDATRLDAFLAFKIPSDGKYFVTIRDTTYRGGTKDFHYRLTVAEGPTITAVFPPGGPKGQRVVATVYGYNLTPQGATTLRTALNLPAAGTGEFRLSTAGGTSNAVPIVGGDGFEAAEVEPNDRVQDATPVQLPVTCWGKFDSAKDMDGFRFEAQAGQTLIFETAAGRLGSQADTYLTLMDRGGKVIARDDDGGGQPDARLQVQIPTTDEYVVFVRNQNRGFGPTHFYRLWIHAPQQTFDAVFRQNGVNRKNEKTMVDVDSVTIPAGGYAELRVDLDRKEGQSGDVMVAWNPPPSIRGIRIEQLVREAPKSPQATPRESVTPNPVIKNGQNSVTVRISADPALLQPGTYVGAYIQLRGLVRGTQPYALNKPIWLTVEPRQ